MDAEQRLEMLAHRGIISTSLVQVGSPLAGWQFQSRAKDGYFAIGRVHGLLNAPPYNGADQTANETLISTNETATYPPWCTAGLSRLLQGLFALARVG
jgi:hypothetical protein